MKKKITIALILLLTCTGCAQKNITKNITSEDATKIIKEFNSKNYSYTCEISNLSKDGSKEVLDTRKGVKTENPYIQYEITTLDPPQGEYEKYWIEDDSNIQFFVNLALSDGQVSEWITSTGESNKEGRGTSTYDRGGLVYNFDRFEDPYFVVYTEYDKETKFNAYALVSRVEL